MKTFLEYVADDMLGKYGNDLSNTAVVFPNKRAALFLNDHLARSAARPIWSPAYITISDLFRRQSTKTVGDPIKLVCDLHKSFIHCTGIDESLDYFYSWGQLLLSDFDDIDKHMVDADRIFANVRDIHEIDDVSYLSDSQKETLKQFFSNFSDDHNTLLKQRFIQMWSHLADIYHDYNRRLESQHIAYEGALYREVADGELTDIAYDRYLFVGFNLMQPVEQTLCERLMKMQKARFYWDFDHYYLHDHEAGHFICDYLQRFPNEFASDSEFYSQMNTPKKITFVSAPTENIQARYIPSWLRQHHRIDAERRTAIILCDENLLQTAIHCLPDEVQKINITTGYPLSQTPVASLINLLLTDNRRLLQRHPYAALIKEVERNDSLTDYIMRCIRQVATTLDTHNDALTEEALFRAYTLMNRVNQLVINGDLSVDIITLQRLVSQLLQSTTIPFHGEPAVGIQMMGVLETRNLDFDHVLLLSCNEGNMPKGVNDASFIPYSIRKAYGLTTSDHKVAIYAYYFHRLLQRASDVTMVYNNSTEDGHTGEMSRFMLQLMVNGSHHIERVTLQAGQLTTTVCPGAVNKDDDVMSKLAAIRFISPTALNRYLRCPLEFYYYHVAGIKEPDDNEEGEIDNRLFGNIFHHAAEKIYRQMMAQGNTISRDHIDYWLKHPERIEMVVDHTIIDDLFHLSEGSPMPQLTGLQIISREVIIRYLRQLLRTDRQLTPFAILGLELPVRRQLSGNKGNITLGGYIDRLDMVNIGTDNERIRVVDYKTGHAPLKTVGAIDEVFDAAMMIEKHTDYYLQTILYALMVAADQNTNSRQLPVSPALLFIQNTQGPDYDPTIEIDKQKVTDVSVYAEPFRHHVEGIIDELFTQAQPFVPTDNKELCARCPYRQLCLI